MCQDTAAEKNTNKVVGAQQGESFDFVNYTSDLPAEDSLFLFNKGPHDLAWRQFTCCDKVHDDVIHSQDRLYSCNTPKKRKKKLKFSCEPHGNQH